MKLLLVCAAFLVVANCASISLEDLEFHAWKLKFERSYPSPSEEAERKEIWLTNRKLVVRHNIMADEGIKSYRLGMTYFADMNNTEYQELISRGCLHSFNVSQPRTLSTVLRKTNLPKTVDWRDKGAVTPVKNQKQCGSCWAFSATGSLEGQHFRKTGKLVSLSEQQLIDCSSKCGNHGCRGGWMTNAFKYVAANRGIDTEKSYPYEAKDGRCRYNPANVGGTCTGFVKVRPNDEMDLKEKVATVGPVSVAIDASQHTFQLYKSGVYNEPHCSSTRLDHGVLAVGYGSYNGADYWLVKNSWGTGWGNNGYIMMSRNKKNQCGVATAASYPVVKQVLFKDTL